MIEVKLFAYFRDNRGKSVNVEYYPGITILDIVKELDIDPELVSISLINGRHQPLEKEVEDGKKVFLFPPVGGG